MSIQSATGTQFSGIDPTNTSLNLTVQTLTNNPPSANITSTTTGDSIAYTPGVKVSSGTANTYSATIGGEHGLESTLYQTPGSGKTLAVSVAQDAGNGKSVVAKNGELYGTSADAPNVDLGKETDQQSWDKAVKQGFAAPVAGGETQSRSETDMNAILANNSLSAIPGVNDEFGPEAQTALNEVQANGNDPAAPGFTPPGGQNAGLAAAGQWLQSLAPGSGSGD